MKTKIPLGTQTLPGINKPQIRGLLLERNQANRRAITRLMRAKGVQMAAFGDGQSTLNAWEEQGPFDFMIINPAIRDMNGFTVCHYIRSDSAIPIIMYAKIRTEGFKYQAYRMGASDYLQAPFAASQLIVRLNRLLSLSGSFREAARARSVYGELVMDPQLRWVYKGSEVIKLSPIQYDVLDYLVKNVGSVVSAKEIILKVWGLQSGYAKHLLVREIIQSLRRKLEDDPTQPTLLLEIEGAGYRLG